MGHLIDIMPTICELTGAPYPRQFNGRGVLPLEGQSLAPQIKNGITVPRKPIFWSLNGHKAVLSGDYKLEAAGEEASWELYDLKNDRSELNNLAGSHTETVKRLSKLWEEWAERVGVSKGQLQKQSE